MKIVKLLLKVPFYFLTAMFLVAHIFFATKGMTSFAEERFGLMEEDGTKIVVFNMTSRDMTVSALSISGGRFQRVVLSPGGFREFDFLHGIDCFFLEEIEDEKDVDDLGGDGKEILI